MAVKSEILNSHLENHKTESIEGKVKFLSEMWLDVNLFKEQISRILEKNPGSESIICHELDRTRLVAENQITEFNRSFRSILDSTSNNPNWSPDESLVA